MKTKILVVEDSGPMRSLIAAALEEHLEVDVYEAESGFAALKLIPDTMFNIIITDINMPDINGLELISFLRQHPNFKSVPIIIISTEGAEADRKRGIEIGANDYLVKPFTEGQLVNTIQKFLT